MLACCRLHLKLNNHKEYKQKTNKTKKKHKKTFKKKQKQKKLFFYISSCYMLISKKPFNDSNFGALIYQNFFEKSE